MRTGRIEQSGQNDGAQQQTKQPSVTAPGLILPTKPIICGLFRDITLRDKFLFASGYDDVGGDGSMAE